MYILWVREVGVFLRRQDYVCKKTSRIQGAGLDDNLLHLRIALGNSYPSFEDTHLMLYENNAESDEERCV